MEIVRKESGDLKTKLSKAQGTSAETAEKALQFEAALKIAKDKAKTKENEALQYKGQYEEIQKTANQTKKALADLQTQAAQNSRDLISQLATARSATDKAKDDLRESQLNVLAQKKKMDAVSADLATQLNVNSNDILKLARQAATTIADQAVMIAKTKKEYEEKIEAENTKATKLRKGAVGELNEKLEKANSEVQKLNKASLVLQGDLRAAAASVQAEEDVTDGLRGTITEMTDRLTKVNAELANLRVAAAAAESAAQDFERASKKEAAQQNLALQIARKKSAEALAEANKRLKEEKDARQDEKAGLNSQLNELRIQKKAMADANKKLEGEKNLLERRAVQAERSVRLAAEKAEYDTNARIKAEMNLQSTIDKINDDIAVMQLTSSSLLQDKSAAIQSLEASKAQEQISSKTLAEVHAKLAAVTSEKEKLKKRADALHTALDAQEDTLQDEQGKMPAGIAVLIAVSVVALIGSVGFCIQKRVPARLWQKAHA